MKKKYIIETDYEITNCNACPTYLNEFDYTSADYCVILDQSTDKICELREKLPNCPLKELKPKQLEWEEYNKRSHIYVLGANPNETCVIYVSNTPIGKAIIHELINGRGIKIEFEAITRFIFSAKELIEAKQSINNAKKFCQKYYNKLFYEMISEIIGE